MPCSVTTRVSLRWLPSEPFEDCDVMVLSVSNHFLDIRVKRDYSKIDWAFAGVKHIESDGKNVWTHEVDTRGWKDEDSGYLSPLENGDELETGSMRNPDNNNEVMAHEEVWRNIPTRKQCGFIARNQEGSEWLALVDDHALRLHKQDDQCSAARYLLSSTDQTWVAVYAIGPKDLGAFDARLIDAITHNEAWIVLASEDFDAP